MFGCHKKESTPPRASEELGGNTNGAQGENSKAPEDPHSSLARYLKTAAVGAGAFAAPHVLCLLGLSGAVGGYFGFKHLCGDEDPVLLKPLVVPRYEEVPSDYTLFPEAVSAQAASILLEVQPDFREVVAAKSRESVGAHIEIVFFRDNNSGTVGVGVCKDGMLCPCSNPQFFMLGTKGAAEQFPGQGAILDALYKEDGGK